MNSCTRCIATATLMLALSPLAIAQTPCASPGAQIIAWWDAAPSGSNLATDLTGRTDALLLGGATLGAMPGFTNEAFVFDGQNAHVASTAEMNGLDGDFWSFEGWLRPARLGVFQGVIAKLDPAIERAGDFALVITPDGRLQIRYLTNASGGTTERIFQTRPVLSVGTAHHIAARVTQGSNVAISVDGIAESLTSTNQSFGALPFGGFDRSTFVGCVVPGTLHFEGEMDELTFYDRLVTRDEFTQVALAGNSLKCKQAAPLPAGVVSWFDGEICREHALDRVGLDAISLEPRTGAVVTSAPGLVGDGFDLTVGGGLDARRPLLRTTGPFTIEMWVFRTRTGEQEILYMETAGPTRVAGDCILRFADGSIRLVRATGIGLVGEGVSSRLPIDTGVWTHIAAVFAGPGDLRLFVNGERDDRPVDTLNFNLTPALHTGFGIRPNAFNALRAPIDECTLYRSAVSGAEIEAIYRAGRFGKVSQVDRALDCRDGSTEDLVLTVTLAAGQELSPPSFQLASNDRFLVNMTTPAGTFGFTPYGIMAQPYVPAAPPFGLPGVPEFAIDFSSAAFIAGGLTPSAFGTPLLNPAGARVALSVPPSLSGIRVRIQGFAISPLAANGTFAATDPIDLQIRASSAGPGL